MVIYLCSDKLWAGLYLGSGTDTLQGTAARPQYKWTVVRVVEVSHILHEDQERKPAEMWQKNTIRALVITCELLEEKATCFKNFLLLLLNIYAAAPVDGSLL